MRIGFFTDTYYPTINGVSASTEYFAEELAALGHHVAIFCPKYKGSKNVPGDITKPGMSIYRCPSFPVPTNPEHAVTFPQLGFGVDIKSLKLDIIHLQSPFVLGSYGASIARKLKIPLTQTYHTFWEDYLHYFVLPQFISRPLMVWQNTKLCNESVVNFVPSPQMTQGLIDYGVKTKLVVCPTGIDVDRFRKESNKKLVKSHLGIPKEKKILLFASRMCVEKSPDIVIKAFALVQKKLPDTILVMTGDGPMTQDVKRLVKKMGLEKSVTITGYLDRPDLYAYYEAADLFVFPSTSETQGLVVLEAQAFETPVIGVAKMGVEMLLKGDKGGLLAKDRDPEEIAGLCLKLLKDKKLYAKKSKEALANARKWRTSEYAKLMEKELIQLLDKSK